MADTKKPKKVIRVAFLINQFKTKEAEIPGMTDEALIAQIQLGNYTVSEKELQEIVDKEQVDTSKVEEFVAFLQLAECITKSGGGSRGGGSGERSTTINSPERAREVANDPTDEVQVALIVEKMTALVELRNEIKPLIDQHAEVSLALKNKKVKEEEVEPAPDAEDQYPPEENVEDGL